MHDGDEGHVHAGYIDEVALPAPEDRYGPWRASADPAKDLNFDSTSVAMSWMVAVLLLSALAPLFVVEIPAMIDYVNHLARMNLPSAGTASPAYEVRWRLYPNLAMDLVVPLLGKFMSVETAGKAFLGMSEALVVTGGIALEFAVKRRHRLGGLSALAVLFSLPFAWGLTNFMCAMGVATWGVALWITLRSRGPLLRWTVHAGIVLILFVSHLFALGVYGLTIGLFELSALAGRPSVGLLLRLGAFMASPVLMLIGVMAISGGAVGAQGIDWDFGLKLLWPLLFMNIYDQTLSVVTAAVLAGLLIALAIGRRLTLAKAGAWIGCGLLLTYAALPRRLFGVAYVDVRLITAAALILPAFLQVSLPLRPWRYAPVVLVVAVILVNQASTARAWLSHQTDYQQIRESFRYLSPGDAVLIGLQDGSNALSPSDSPLYFAPTLAAPDAGAFVASLYSERGLQPIQPSAKFRPLAVRDLLDYLPTPLPILVAAANGATDARVPPHVEGWLEHYQFLYLIGRAEPNPLPSRLTRIAEGARFVLYRVDSASGNEPHR